MSSFFENQSIILTLDADAFLFERIQQAIDEGFSIIEVNTCDESLLKKLLAKFPRIHIGAGNITNTQQLENCFQAGVHFVSSPGFLPSIVKTAAIYSINYIPGIATVSEGMQVLDLGCHQAKPLPASLDLCELLSQTLPTLRLYPAGLTSAEADSYLSIPAVAAVCVNYHYQAITQAVD